MVETQALTSETDKSGNLSEPKLEYPQKSPYSGYESVYGKTSTPKIPKRNGYCDYLRKNKPQSYSLLAATMIFTSGGISFASSIGFGEPNNSYGSHIQFCWFIAVIFGACISTSLAHKLSKRVFNIISSVLVIMSGVLYIIAAQSTTAVLLARYCDGIAFGLTLIPALLAGSEQSVKGFRCHVLSVEQLGLVGGALLKTLYTDFYVANMQKRHFVCGTVTVFYGVLALVLTFFFTIESPVFLLRKDNEDEAINSLRKLQYPNAVTNETYALLNENKALLMEDMTRRTSKNISNSWIPMIKMIIFRSFVTMSFSFPLTLTFLTATSMSSRSGVPMSPYVYHVMRLIGVIFSSFFMDKIGRKIPSAVSLFFGGIIIFAVGCLVPSFQNMYGAYVQPVIFLLLIYQILSGIMGPASTCYLSEAFSPSIKPIFILAVVIVENIIQIILCQLTSFNFISKFACVLGGSQLLYAIIFFITMPETMEMTLRQALAMFQKIFVVCNDSSSNEEEREEQEAEV